MGAFSDYLEQAILGHITGKTAYTKPTAYIALSTTAINADGTGITEPSGGGYARAATAGADWNAPSGGSPASTSNANDISFPQATADWGTIGYFALFDAATGGNMLCYGTITTAKDVLNGDTAKFAGGTPGQLVIDLT